MRMAERIEAHDGLEPLLVQKCLLPMTTPRHHITRVWWAEAFVWRCLSWVLHLCPDLATPFQIVFDHTTCFA